MHASVIEAKVYRDRENGRRRHNAKKLEANNLMHLFGLNPAFTPVADRGPNRKIRQLASRQHRKVKRFFINWARLELRKK